MYTQTAYHCSYCKKYGLSKGHIKKHEDNCFKNPITRSCATCANLFSDARFYNNLFNRFNLNSVQCIKGLKFEKLDNEFFEEPQYRLITNCSEWVQMPDDDEIFILYQLKILEETEA